MPVGARWRVDAVSHSVHVTDADNQLEAEAAAEAYIGSHDGEGFVMVCDAAGAVVVAKRFIAPSET